MASSAHKHHIHLPNPYDSAATPPPTPSSTQPDLLSASDAADSISRLLHRLPPTLTLSLPARRSPLSNVTTSTTITTVAPLISFSDPNDNLYSNVFSVCSQHGFFQLIDHNIPSQLAQSAESESLSLFNLSRDQKHLQFPKNWPLGYDADDDDDDEESASACESFCLDSTCFGEPTTALNLSSLHEFTGKLEKLGLNVIEALSCALGFENPAREDPKRISSLMWISENSSSINKPGLSSSGRMYPYVVGLQYQIRDQKYSLSADSGWVSVSPRVDSVLVTIGDIAQVWSNGKLQKVRGRALPNVIDGGAEDSNCISMTLLITLPQESTVSPLLPGLDYCGGDRSDAEEGSCMETAKEERVFSSFSFEDYAWRVYHERRLSLKDPLVRYKI